VQTLFIKIQAFQQKYSQGYLFFSFHTTIKNYFLIILKKNNNIAKDIEKSNKKIRFFE
jgi:hypothetical protein